MCHGFAKRLALAGAEMSTPIKAEPTEKGASEVEIMREEVIIDDELPVSAAKEAATAQANLPEARPSVSNSTMGEQDLDLILNVEDHDLDFEPEEGILDDTVEDGKKKNLKPPRKK